MYDFPSVINVFATQPLTDPLTANWRNVYLIVGVLAAVGAVSILTPLWYLQQKSRTKMTVQRRSVAWLLHEFDAVGAVLITLGKNDTRHTKHDS